MSVEENKALTRFFYDEIVNQKKRELIDEWVSEDFVEHEVFPGLPARGPRALKASFDMFTAVLTDLRITPDELIGEGDKVVMRGTMSGIHSGEFMGIPPTNKSFKVNVIDVIEYRDGKATAHWGVTDLAAMMKDLGIASEM